MANGSMSLRARLVGMMGLLFLLGMLGIYIGARHYGGYAADRAYDRLLAGSALSIAETLSIAHGEVQVDIPYAALDMLSLAPEDRVFYRIFGPGERLVTGYGDLPGSDDAVAEVERSDANAPTFFDADYRGEKVRFALLGRQVAEPGVSGWVWVQIGHTRRARESLADEMVLGAVLPITLITGLALLIVWFGVARALRSLRRAGEDISRRDPADLKPIVEPLPREVAPLVDAINLFMKRLGMSMDTLRAFIAEAAHQMRTPLAALRAQAQEAMESDDAEDLRRGLRAVDRNAAKLSRLLNQLLSDATVIHRSDLRKYEHFDLLQALRRAVRDTVPLHRSARVNIRTAEDKAPFLGDGLILCEAIKNLIDNAIRHGGEDSGDVELSLQRIPGSYVIQVADRGPGVPNEQRDVVFERFVRGSSGGSGAGLGLAIVRQAVESHGGTIRLSDRKDGGLIVEIRLPTGSA